ncbi:DUF4426 domain-containing protein [Lysobacter sp. 5GHs7-4]|uniref:DUF4426 domain-containing protein n=1 Tax=Lysobacter sp. 5GHs7-4 TaxID=2904253 RepID=UPI001E3C5106|nr:DUF4426 domain-containing protein [Lysobacter sp. 5GHs7-4]UHQ22366.1 DUF4426 domain-containing protein [Lysobacter sp. 5GHs7-4]
MRSALAVCLLSLALLAGCGREAAVPGSSGNANAAPQEAVARSGDVTVRASALQTSALSPTVAAQYGIVRDDATVMLLVAVRRGPDGQDVAVPARVSATATDLRGQRHTLELRELRTGEGDAQLLDYIGTVEIALPDTLRFEVGVTPEQGASTTVQFSREFYPR